MARFTRLSSEDRRAQLIDVALACGFVSASHFSKCYRAHYQTTPYRERGTLGKPAVPARLSI